MKRNRFQRTTSLFVMILIFMICFPSTVVFAASLPEKHVLIVNAFTPDYPANVLYSKGIKSKLDQNLQYKFSYSYEYLDLACYSNDKGYFEIVSQYLKAKYAKQQPDFIITAVNLQGLFTKYGNDMFPDVPIIMDWNEDNVPRAPVPSNYIAIPRSINESNIDEYERVCALYRNDLFSKKNYEWCEIKKEWLQRCYLNMLKNMAMYYVGEGMYQSEIDKLLAAERIASFDEEIHKSLLRAYAARKNMAVFINSRGDTQ